MKINPVFTTGILLLLLSVGSVYLFLGGPDTQTTRSFKHLWDLGHIGYFGLLIFLFVQLIVKIKIFRKLHLRYLWTGFIILTLVLGAAIEFLQDGTDREADLADLSRDLMGCLLVLAFHPALKLSYRPAQMIRAMVFIMLLVFTLPLIKSIIDESIARSQFPVLASFETPFELDRWHGSAYKDIVRLQSFGNRALLQIGFETDLYSGAGLRFMPSDWSGFNSLNLRIINPDGKLKPLDLTIRIHDQEHETGVNPYQYRDRFNTRVQLDQLFNDIKIDLAEVESRPRNRKMDLTRISDISLFTVSLKQQQTIFLDEIYLSN